MANRHYSEFKERKLKPNCGSPPSPGLGSTTVKTSTNDSPNPWRGAAGPKGSGYKAGSKGFAEVKIHAHQDMAMDAKLGSGARFAKLKGKLAQNPKIEDPGAVAASIGRKKYGKERFQKLASQGK